MGTGLEVAAIASLVVGAVSTAEQISAQKKAAGRQREAQETQAAQETVTRSEQLRQQFRQERVRRARIEQAAQATGTVGSAGALGAQSVITTNIQSGLAFTAGQTATAEALTRANQEIANIQRTGQIWGGVGQLSKEVFGATGSSLFTTGPSATKTAVDIPKPVA